jgi:hypothetical protein
MLQRAGLRDSAFIAQSNYYYLEKECYLAVLAEVRIQNHDLTAFIKFGLVVCVTRFAHYEEPCERAEPWRECRRPWRSR